MRRLTVLGSCGGYPESGDACNGFLLEWDGYRLVLDLGYGTLAALQQICRVDQLDAVVITHEHPDHCLDLHPLFRARHYGSQLQARLPLYCPPGVLHRLSGVEPEARLEDVFEVIELPGRYQLGPWRLASVVLEHHVLNCGIRLANDHRVVAYTGDTGPTAGIAELGRDADLFIVDATDRPGELQAARRRLLSATEAAQWAGRAGARRLLLTHFWPGTDREASSRRAQQEFGGEVLVARQGVTVALE